MVGAAADGLAVITAVGYRSPVESRRPTTDDRRPTTADR
jgi:hypothetical protein